MPRESPNPNESDEPHLRQAGSLGVKRGESERKMIRIMRRLRILSFLGFLSVFCPVAIRVGASWVWCIRYKIGLVNPQPPLCQGGLKNWVRRGGRGLVGGHWLLGLKNCVRREGRGIFRWFKKSSKRTPRFRPPFAKVGLKNCVRREVWGLVGEA